MGGNGTNQPPGNKQICLAMSERELSQLAAVSANPPAADCDNPHSGANSDTIKLQVLGKFTEVTERGCVADQPQRCG
jgi:hypothetical protein